MNESTIKNLHQDFRLSKDYTPDYIIDFFNTNTDRLKSIRFIDHPDDLRLYIILVWQYAHGLYQKNRFNDTLNTIDKGLIDKEIIRLDDRELKDDWYYGLMLFKGMAAYRLKDFKTATRFFKILVRHDSRNDNYRLWLRGIHNIASGFGLPIQSLSPLLVYYA